MYLVYKHTSPSGKSYIGQTCDYDRRCREHQVETNQCKAFAAAIKKYGWDNFTHEILYDGLTQEQANFREQQAVNEYKSVTPYGYNLQSGGEAKAHSEDTKIKMSAIHKGKTISDYQKKCLSQSAQDPANCAKRYSAQLLTFKKYMVIAPDGTQYTVQGLRAFCSQHNLKIAAMSKVARGIHTHHKGWVCEEIMS